MILAVILMCISLVNSNAVNEFGDNLIFTQVLIRHGHRTVVKSYPNDPYKDISNWPEGIGQLTNLGKQQEFELGKFLSRRYKKFLGTYHPDKISILSSAFDRTISSANLVLAALFPPKGNQVWNEELLWQPIAVHSLPRNVDYFLQPELACDQYIKARTEFENTSPIKALKKQNHALLEYLEKHTGQSVKELEQIKDIYEILVTETEFNKTLPEWTHAVLIPDGAFERLARYWYAFITGTDELKKLRGGFLLKQIFDRFKNKTQSNLPKQLMHIYSGHDSTIASVLNTLGVFEIHAPPHSSSVLFELYESNGSNYIQIFYRNSTAEKLTPLNIPKCGQKCSINELYELYSHVLASDTKTECHGPGKDSYNQENNVDF